MNQARCARAGPRTGCYGDSLSRSPGCARRRERTAIGGHPPVAGGQARIYVVCWALLFGMGMVGGGVYTYVGPMAAQRFGASALLIGLIFAASAIASMVGGPAAGLITDRIGGRKSAVVAGLSLGGLGTLGVGASGNALALLAAMLCSAIGGIGMPLLLAYVGDAARAEAGEGAAPRTGTTMVVRIGFALGFAAGAPLGGLAAQEWGYAAPALSAGVMQFGLAAAAFLALPSGRGGTAGLARPLPTRGVPASLVLFCLAGILVMMGEQAKSQFLPLRLTQQLHLPPTEVGLLFGAQAAMELAILPLAGYLADRIGLAPALLITFSMPAFYLLGVSTATSVPVLFGLQLLEAAAVAGFSGLAYVQAQRLAPGREGFGVALYSSGFSAARLATGLVVGSASQVVGIAGGLRVGAVAALFGWLLLLVALRRGEVPLQQRQPAPTT